MSFSISPGITINEIDLTGTIPTLPSSTGAMAGNFRWGPLNEVVTISGQTSLIDKFGTPGKVTTDASPIDFFCASNFLSYSNRLKVVRAGSPSLIKTASSNATTGGITTAANSFAYSSNFDSVTGVNAITGPFIAKYPGELGSSLKVVICDANTDALVSSWAAIGGNSDGTPGTGLSKIFRKRPGTSPWVKDKKNNSDEVHILVIDEDGKFTGTKDLVLEKFEYLSRAIDAKNVDGSTNYYREVINKNSKYIYWAGDPRENFSRDYPYGTTGFSGNTINAAVPAGNSSFSLTGGSDNSGVINEAALIDAYSKLENPDEVDYGLIFTSNTSANVVNSIIEFISAGNLDPTGAISGRKDAVLCISPPLSAVFNNYGQEANSVIDYRNTLNESSYTIMDSGWKYQYDKFNDLYLWVPLCADVAGICAKTDKDRGPWFSPAGFNRGYIKNIVKLAWNPKKSERDLIYSNEINPVVSFSGQGTVLFGDKTLYSRPSAFDRINVRRLFIYLEKNISIAAKQSLFEFNDSFTRARFVNLVEPYLRDVQGRRGIYDFRVICDETNNTPEIIDANEFVGDIYIQPARSINYIQLNFVATRTGVNFDEIVGQI